MFVIGYALDLASIIYKTITRMPQLAKFRLCRYCGALILRHVRVLASKHSAFRWELMPSEYNDGGGYAGTPMMLRFRIVVLVAELRT